MRFGEIVERNLSREQLLSEVGRFDVLIVRLGHVIDRKVIEAGLRLKAIVTPTTGLDHIDLGYATSMGITVLSLQGEVDFLRSVTATAEHTWALLLALIRRVVPATASVLRGEWRRDLFKGHQLAGKQLGLVGLGRLGQRVACFGQAFQMRVRAFDPYVDAWPEGVERAPTLEDLLRTSDVISLHLPLNDKTRGIIGRAEFRLMPEGTLLLNTSRGAIMDEEALVGALRSRHLGGAGLDVLVDETEPGLGQSALLRYAASHDNLLVTPHLGGATYESMEATEIFMAQKLAAALNGTEIVGVGK
jgi:D-3-phosphoglycerate dehydrogenase